MAKIFCEYRACEISATGCIARQKRAVDGFKRWSGTKHYYSNKDIPYDSACRDCEQGKKVKEMVEFPEFPEKVELVKEALTIKETIKEAAEKHTDEIPYGYCQCGCGIKTNLVQINDRKKGLIKGEPNKFLRGHAGSRKSEASPNKKIDVNPEKQKPVSVIPIGNVRLDFNLLPDGKELRSALGRIAEEELRTTEAQATWMIAKLIRGYCDTKAD
jgi:hypothetical protein